MKQMYKRIRLYSLSDLIWLLAFSSFFPTKSSFLPSKLAYLLGALPRVCINIILVLTPKNVDCKIFPLPTMTISRVSTVGNGQINSDRL